MSGSIYDRLHERRATTEEQEPENPEVETAPPPPPLRYRTNELSFVRPDGFLDKTFHVLSQSETGPSPFSIVVGRSHISASEKLETLSAIHEPHLSHDGAAGYRGISGEQFHGSRAS